MLTVLCGEFLVVRRRRYPVACPDLFPDGCHLWQQLWELLRLLLKQGYSADVGSDAFFHPGWRHPALANGRVAPGVAQGVTHLLATGSVFSRLEEY